MGYEDSVSFLQNLSRNLTSIKSGSMLLVSVMPFLLVLLLLIRTLF